MKKIIKLFQAILNIFIFLALYYILSFIGSLLFLLFCCFITKTPLRLLPTNFIDSNFFMIDGFACFLTMLVYLLIYKCKKYNKNKIINKLPKKDIPKYALISIGMGGLSALWLIFADKILSSITLVKNSLQNFSQISESLNNEAYIFIFLSVILFGPIVEELLFRGLIFNEIDKIKGGAAPIILSGLLFGLFHREPVQVVYASILGIILGFVYSKTRSLPLVIFMHMLNNLVATLPPPLAKHEILQFVNGFQIISIVPMAYLLYRLYKKGSLTN